MFAVKLEFWKSSEYAYTQSILQQLSIPRCQPSQWCDEDIMNSLYKHHLKKQTIANVNWLQLFKEWKSCGNIIEINTALDQCLAINKKGSNGIRRILSIIANKFSYEELQSKLEISSNTINMARKYAILNGPGGQQIDKPKITHNPPLSKEIENQFQAFFFG
ncbi:hypothetical protein Glove_141g94 [Diversispora epigaea]|uniref:Uncharacterized protein n=1 Tax=Diversispora epigaea TaxID=1348612 RepID=A0A397IUQ0_9GLOM|nr:hypothetical protein Glove_141g94 [Diversispora epigaea]